MLLQRLDVLIATFQSSERAASRRDEMRDAVHRLRASLPPAPSFTAADALAAMEPDAAAAKGEDVDVLPFARLRSSQACLSGNLCVMQTSVPQWRHRYAFTAVSFSLHLGAPQRFDLLGCLFGSHEVDECRSKVTWMLSPGTCLTLLPHSGHTTHVVSCA